ncbi:DUF6385 domain-containing protein [Paenibacillus wynnii]|uniref:DUF6385 domain-containing protein n=1 Tax=Paenibacillus wynnii TaxID=268407 RepID=UPI00278C97E9|nr:DUF6385 domain-containing protein [Paenibacillus wynnii]MDQ0194841.1 hypothetical protein [Paenibacillus wynnii]
MKVFTDTQTQFFSTVFQPTASNLKVEPVQTTASNLQTMVSQSSASNLNARVSQSAASLLNARVRQTAASLLNARVRQTAASLLNARVRQTAASLLNARVRQTAASLLNATVRQSAASLLQTTLGDRKVITADLAGSVTTTGTYSSTSSINVVSLSQFSFMIKGGTATTNLKLQLSPNGTTDWLDDDTVTRTLAAGALTIYTATRYSRFARLAYKRGTAAGTSTISIFYQGQV